MEPELVSARHVKQLFLVWVIMISLVIIKAFYCLQSNKIL